MELARHPRLQRLQFRGAFDDLSQEPGDDAFARPAAEGDLEEALTGPVEGSLNGESTYFAGSSSSPNRESTISVASARTPAIAPDILPVVSIAMASVGPAPSSNRSWRGVISPLMSRRNCSVAASATAFAAVWKGAWGASGPMGESLLMPSSREPESNGPP